jgi:archaellum component FlaC
MPDVTERLDKVEGRLGVVEERLGAVEGRLGAVEIKVDALDAKVETLSGDVQKLRVLGEDNARDIKLIAEVQAQHGAKLEEISKALEPLARIDAFVTLVAHDHAKRITALEKAGGRGGGASEVPTAG